MFFTSYGSIGLWSDMPHPLKQLKAGVPFYDIICKNGFVLVIKSEDKSPACVDYTGMQKLVGWGWTKYPDDITDVNPTINSLKNAISGTINVSNTNFTLNYTITNAKVMGITKNMDTLATLISIHTNDNGILAITIPRDLVDTTINGNKCNCRYEVIMNSLEINFLEIRTTSIDRTLFIPFVNGTNEITIIGNFVKF
jgi:hypothetical protein